MLSGKSILAIIPARAGSRRCPNKNLRPFMGVPLIQLAINQASACKEIDTIVISSDSDEILTFAKPPVIPLKRPAFLSTSQATSEAVIAHILYSTTLLGEASIPPHDFFVLLQPTSPFRTPADITACLKLAITFHGVSLSVNESHQRNGAVYVSSSERFLSTLSLAPASRQAEFVMSNLRSHDIDYPEDFTTLPTIA